MAQARKRPEEEREERPRLREVMPEEEEEKQPTAEEGPQISWMAIVGLGLAIIAWFIPVLFAMISGAAAVALGIAALMRIRKGEESGDYLAWGAIVIGAVITVLAFIAVLSSLF